MDAADGSGVKMHPRLGLIRDDPVGIMTDNLSSPDRYFRMQGAA